MATTWAPRSGLRVLLVDFSRKARRTPLDSRSLCSPSLGGRRRARGQGAPLAGAVGPAAGGGPEAGHLAARPRADPWRAARGGGLICGGAQAAYRHFLPSRLRLDAACRPHVCHSQARALLSRVCVTPLSSFGRCCSALGGGTKSVTLQPGNSNPD